MKVKVNNLPLHYEPYIVARAVDGELWFWGSWDDMETAHTIANDIGGIVVDIEDEEE